MVSHTTQVIDAAGYTIGGVSVTTVNTTSATTTPVVMTAAANANRMMILDRAAGITVTLPASTGGGATYSFFVKTAVSAASYIIKVANASDVMSGFSILGPDGAALLFGTAATSDTITMNATTTGGLAGARVVIRDIALNLFQVEVYTKTVGTPVTPFSATV